MKEQLQANIITKHLAGWCNKQEEEFLKNWLKTNPSNQLFFGVIKQRLQEVEVQLKEIR